MLYDNYRNKILRRAAALRQVIHLSPVITAALIVFITVFTVLALAAGTVTDVSFANSASYGSGPAHSASAFLSDTSFEYRLKGVSEWSSETPKMPGDYDVRVVTKGFFGTRYKELDTFHVYPRRVSVTAAETSIAYGETPLAKAALNYGDKVVCESFVFESNVLANTKIKANASAVRIYNAEGEDVTYAYEIETPYSDITVTKRELLVYVSDATHQYDGEEFSYKVYKIGEGSLPEGERLQAKFEKTITDVGTVKNVPVVQIINKHGEDVTHFYNLNEQNIGNLIVTKRPLHIITGTASYTFDGEAKKCLDYAMGNGTSILPEHEIIVDAAKTQTFIGSVNNTMSFSVKDKNTGEDVTDNYAITVTEGMLTVEKCTVTVTTGSQEWEYDGEKHSNADITVDGLVFGTISDERYDIKDMTDVGTMENLFTVKIVNGTSDITENYNIVYKYGTLEITPRRITIETPSYSWEYDGNEHTVNDVVISGYVDIECNILSGALLDGCHIRYNFEYYLTSNTVQPTVVNVWAPADNTVPVRIVKDKFDAATNTATSDDITRNFEITYVYGKLEVTPRPITVKPVDVSKVYDGTRLAANEIEIIEGGLAKDTHILEYKLSGSRTYVTDEEVSTITEIKITSGGEDITRNYKITTEAGKLEITPRPLNITIGSAEYEFDGTGKECRDYDIDKNTPLVRGDNVQVIKATVAIFAGTVPNKLEFAVKDANGRDVTINYAINATPGKIIITRKPITVITGTPAAPWVYDGEAHSYTEYTVFPADGIVMGESTIDNRSITYITDVKDSGMKNSFKIKILYEGTDITDSYDISYKYGTLTVIACPITIKTPSHSFEYDGNENGVATYPGLVNEYQITSGELPIGHWLEYDETLDKNKATIVNVKDSPVPNTSTVCIFRGSDGDNVTDNFEITYDEEYGMFWVTPRPITVKPNDVSETYDGNSHYPTKIVTHENSNKLVKNHQFADYELFGSRVDAGTEVSSINTVKGVRILDNGKDVTDNYDISYADGTITVLRRPITVTSGSARKRYDGDPLVKNEFSATNLVKDHKIECNTNSSLIGSREEIEEIDNDYDESEMKIYYVAADGEKVYVTHNYDITFKRGKLKVYPYIATIHITSGSAKKVYDGTPLTCDEFSAEYIIYDDNMVLEDGNKLRGKTDGTIHELIVTIDGSITDFDPNAIREVDNNIAEVKVIDVQTGQDVTDWYDITTEPGKLCILPPNDILHFVDENYVYIKFIPQKSGPIYLKMTSKGDYNHTSKLWGDAPEYTELINGYNASYFTPIALENIGYNPSELKVETWNIYMLPYYTAMGNGYSVPSNDADVKETPAAPGEYTVPYYILDSRHMLDSEEILNALKNNLDEYTDAEKVYRNFVYNNYLGVDGDTGDFLQGIIAQKGFDKNNPRIILDVAEYIQGVAKYNLDYNKELDCADNVVIEFLKGEKFTEGICRHYATAATLLYRALGIPARYVEGFVDFNAKANTSSEMKWNNCHAWVEVYIDGLGWIQVEVTGGDYAEDGNGGNCDGHNGTLVIKPVYQCKVSDGTPLVVDKIVINPQLKALLADGYTYEVKIAGRLRDDLGGNNGKVIKGKSWISEFTLKDPNGKDVTDMYDIKYEYGDLEILPKDYSVFEIYLGELRKEYDGTPLSTVLGNKTMLEPGVNYFILSSGNGNLSIKLNDAITTDAISLHITELNDNVNKYIEFTVNSGLQDITDKCRVKFVVFPGMEENKYIPIEVAKRKIKVTNNEITMGSFVKGHKLSPIEDTVVKDDGTVETIVTGYLVLDENNNIDVTHNYEFS